MTRPTYFAFALALCATAAFAQPAPQAPAVPPASESIPATAPDEGTPNEEVPAEEARQEAPRTIVTETRERGQVTGATVTRGNNTYYLKPNTQAGSAQPGDLQSSGNRAAQWQILQFDLQRQEPDRPSAPPPAAPQN